MSRDLTTEAISHFVGFFSQTVEEARMRQDYDAFKAMQRLNDQHDGLLNVTVNVSSDYNLADFEPNLNARITDYSEARITPGPPADPLPVDLGGLGIFGANSAGNPVMTYPMQLWGGGISLAKPVLPPPSSVATAIVQKISLQDTDLLITATPTAGFVPSDYHIETLMVMAQMAKDLSLDWPATLPETGDDITPLGVAFYQCAQDAPPPAIDGATIHHLTGAEAAGIHVNGSEAGELPDLDAALPPFLQREEDDHDELPHEVITGANNATNALSLSINWIDAPVMAVMGDSHSMNAIAQVNVLSNLDRENGTAPLHGAADTTHNIAAILNSAIPPATDADAPGEDAPEFPDTAIVARLTDDLVNFNWVEQYNYLVDNDILSVQFSGNESFLQTGGNTATNLTLLQELGFHYDLIVVGGDLINISIINQVNVLLDNDSVTYSDGWLTSGDSNLLWNEAVIETLGHDAYGELSIAYEALGESLAAGSDNVGAPILENSAFEGLDMLKVLYIDGDLINFQYISQTNMVGDADQLQLHAAQMAAQDGAEASLVVGENALLNLATIYEAGLNSEIQIGGDHYSDALMYQAGLIVTDESQLASDGGNGLANEAVVFLTEENSETNHQQDQATPHPIGDDMGADPMGGVLI
ncbi:hypothetical protein [Roseovarius sp. MMSF_3281]|uniref:hypothetical protein n=1 Tax=Roseovarius sp. MMSF_3281 TaxID=3046694 RepID=UPI00273F37E5|nr:hypothetical protein [Roseovarius sp. MMSF_3281]